MSAALVAAQETIIALLTEQNRRLTEELAAIKSQMSVPATPVVAPAKTTSKKATKPESESKKKLTVSVEGQAAHKATGHRVAALNAIRKEFMANAQLNGEW